MKQRTLFYLKLVLFIIVTPILGFFIFVLPRVITGLTEVIPVPVFWRYPGLIALYAATIAFIFGLYQSIKLLININKDKVFSQITRKSLKNIKYCTGTISTLYVISMPLLYLMADKDDAPGILLFGLVVTFVTAVSASYAAVFEKRSQGYQS